MWGEQVYLLVRGVRDDRLRWLCGHLPLHQEDLRLHQDRLILQRGRALKSTVCKPVDTRPGS